MKLEINQLLRATFKDSDLIHKIPEEVLPGLEFRIINEMKSQLKLSIEPTLQSVARSILDDIKPELKPEFLELIKKIKEADQIDESTQMLMLHKARREANRKLMRLLCTIEEEGTKEEKEILKRMEDLKLDIQEDFARPISANDYKALVRIEEQEVQIDVDWFKDNGITFKRKVLYAIITMTNGGKTILKTWLAFELLKQGQHILFLAQEEPKEDTIRRIHQQALNLSEEQYHALTKEDFNFVGEKFNRLSQEKGWGTFWVAEWSGIKIDLLKKKVEQLEEEHNIVLDGIIIDYAKLIDVNTKSTQEWERLGKVFAELKALAMKQDKWIITSMQLNREASQSMINKGTTPDLFDVAGAYEATHHVNYAWVARLHYTDLQDHSPNENTVKGTFVLTVQKEKYGNLHRGDSCSFQWTADHRLTQRPPTPTAGDMADAFLV